MYLFMLTLPATRRRVQREAVEESLGCIRRVKSARTQLVAHPLAAASPLPHPLLTFGSPATRWELKANRPLILSDHVFLFSCPSSSLCSSRMAAHSMGVAFHSGTKAIGIYRRHLVYLSDRISLLTPTSPPTLPTTKKPQLRQRSCQLFAFR
jgi:hypothetical protein